MTCPLISAVVEEPKSHSLICFCYACIPLYSVLEITSILDKMFYFLFLDIALQCWEMRTSELEEVHRIWVG